MKGHYSAALSSPSQINILLFVAKGIQNLLTITNSRTACRISLLPFRIERKLALTCSNTQITLQYKHHKRATKILTDKNACNNNVSNNKKREGRITSRLGGDFYCFILFLMFLVFSVIFYVFICFSLVLYYFLFGFLCIFKCFWSRTTQEMTGPRIPPPFLVREFLVLTRLKSYSR